MLFKQLQNNTAISEVMRRYVSLTTASINLQLRYKAITATIKMYIRK